MSTTWGATVMPVPRTKTELREHMRTHHGKRGRKWWPYAEESHRARHAGRPYNPSHTHEEALP